MRGVGALAVAQNPQSTLVTMPEAYNESALHHLILDSPA
jgi:hypothetical protein